MEFLDTPLCPHIIASDHTEKQPPQETPLHFQHRRNVTHAQIPLARGTSLNSDLSWKLAMPALGREAQPDGTSRVEAGRGGKSAVGRSLPRQGIFVVFFLFVCFLSTARYPTFLKSLDCARLEMPSLGSRKGMKVVGLEVRHPRPSWQTLVGFGQR